MSLGIEVPSAAPVGLLVGTIVAWYGNADDLPDCWQVCDGGDVKGSFPEYFKRLGPKKPDLRGMVLVGAGRSSAPPHTEYGVDLKTMGHQGGEEQVTLTEKTMPKHQHHGFGDTKNHPWPFGYFGTGHERGSAGNSDTNNFYFGTSDAGEGKAHENRQPFGVVYYIVYLGAAE